jgi:hypothetical protein
MIESGAIMQHLAQKTARFGSETRPGRVAFSARLSWQKGGRRLMAG